jgi:exonuclease III
MRAAGYEAAHHSGGRWAGVAILARAGLPITDVACGLDGEVHADQARWVEATLDRLCVASVYMVNGQAGARHRSRTSSASSRRWPGDGRRAWFRRSALHR